MPRPNQRPPAGQPVQGRSAPSLPRPWLGAAACFGPSLNPLGRFAQQSEMAARITRTATIQGEPAKGGVPCPRSASGTRPTCRTVRPRGDNRHSSRPQGCNLCHPKRTGTRSGKNCFSFGIDIFYRGHRGHAVNKCSKLLLPLINSVPRTSRGQKLSTGDTGDKIALSTGVNPNKCRQFA